MKPTRIRSRLLNSLSQHQPRSYDDEETCAHSYGKTATMAQNVIGMYFTKTFSVCSMRKPDKQLQYFDFGTGF